MTAPSKAAMRAEAQRRIRSLSAKARAEASARICGHLRRWLEALRPEPLAAFHPLATEPDIRPLFVTWMEQAARILLPGFDEGAWGWREADLGEGWQPGYQGLPSPVRSAPANPASVQAVLVPGLAFDRLGTRLGRGGGVYDRLLAGVSAPKIAVAFHVQLMDDPLPREPHDVRMDQVLTEYGWLDPAGLTPHGNLKAEI